MGFFPAPFSVIPHAWPRPLLRQPVRRDARDLQSPPCDCASPSGPELFGRDALLGPSSRSVVCFMRISYGTRQCVFHWKDVCWSHRYSGLLCLSRRPLQRTRKASSGGCFASPELPESLLLRQTCLPALPSRKECGFVWVPFPLPCPALGICLPSIRGVGGFQHKGKFLSGIYEVVDYVWQDIT